MTSPSCALGLLQSGSRCHHPPLLTLHAAQTTSLAFGLLGILLMMQEEINDTIRTLEFPDFWKFYSQIPFSDLFRGVNDGVLPMGFSKFTMDSM